MNGCEPFKGRDIRRVLASFAGEYRVRNRCLVTLGIRTGFRISELLSLRIDDVWVDEKIVDRVYVRKSKMKGQKEGRAVPLHREAKVAIAALVLDYKARGKVDGKDPLFRSGKTFTKPIHRSTAWRIIRRAARQCGIVGRIGTHTMRKTFAGRMYDIFKGDIFAVQQALGQKRVDSTVKYVRFKQEKIVEAILR